MDEAQRLQFFEEFSKFDITFCFSVTMWIHLNFGDVGLKEFLYEICRMSKVVVIEPQPWKCYKAAVKRLKLGNEEFSHYDSLKIRTNVEENIENIITNFKAVKLYESKLSNWQRKVVIFDCSQIT